MEELLEKWPITSSCQASFTNVVKCEVIDNNMHETLNRVILEARSKPIISTLKNIRQYVMTRITIKRDYTMKWRRQYGTNILVKIGEKK